MPQSPHELERIGEEASEKYELEDTAVANAPPDLAGGQMALKSALDMDSTTSDAPLHSSPENPLPLSSPETWRTGRTLAARRRRVRSTPPSIELTKPLLGMGDSLNWKLSVLHKFNAIQYTL